MTPTKEHTKGPWKLTQESVDPEWHIVTAVGGRIVANVHIERGNAMDEANAALIVAAPGLFTALSDAATFIGEALIDDDLGDDVRPLFDRLMAALKKAKP